MLQTEKIPLLIRAIVLVTLAFSGVTAFAAEAVSLEPLASPLFTDNIEDADKVILVLHRGRPGGQMQTGSRLNTYSARGYSRDATWNQRAARSIAERHGLNYLTDWWMSEIDINCAVLLIEGSKPIDDVITELLDDPEVVSAQKLGVFSTLSSQPNDPFFELQSNASYFNLSNMHLRTTGRNILIAVVDTGIEGQHQDLKGQVAFSKNFVEEISPGYANDMHGTAVAGVIAAHANNEAGIVGVAPDAKLIGLKACWPLEEGKLAALCNSFTLALAVNQALVDEVDVINLSLSGPPDEIVGMLIKEAINRGIVVVAATQWAEESAALSFPASIPGVIAVTDRDFHSWHLAATDQPVFAPSKDIMTTLPNNSYNFVSGTSLGAAQISGYVALLLQENPGLPVTDIHHRLIDINNRQSAHSAFNQKDTIQDEF